MNLICETEDFQTYEDAYIGSAEDEGVFQSLSDLFLRTMEEDYEQRRKIRSLLEVVCRCDNRKWMQRQQENKFLCYDCGKLFEHIDGEAEHVAEANADPANWLLVGALLFYTAYVGS